MIWTFIQMSSLLARDLACPDGLEEVLENLTREVLRRQPEDILGFAALYFEKLLQKRGQDSKS